MPYYLARNEQAMVHAAVGYAPDAQPAAGAGLHVLDRPGRDQHGHRRGAGHHQPAAGAAAARRHLRHPRRPHPVLQELEDPRSLRRLGQRRFRPVSRFFDRINGPSSCRRRAAGGDAGADRPGRDRRGHARAAAGRAGRGVRLAGGAVRPRVWHVAAAARAGRAGPRRRGDPRARAAADRRRRRRHLREATEALRAFAEATGIPVAETQAGKGSLPYDHPQSLGAIGATGTTAANALAREADV
jgi:3D-(3,5/4)-trihydroxycyclohexane-1,2-dione acylhydrolase (decyclizing)